MKISLASARTWTSLTFGRRQPIDDGQRRYVRILQSALTALAGRGIGFFVSIISVPLTISYLGTERYGVWITISTMLAWLAIADLGLGNGLTNTLSEAYGTNRRDNAQSYVATAIWMLIGVTVLLATIGALVWPWIDWITLFNVRSTEARAEVGTAVALAITFFLLSFPLSVIGKIYGAYQEGAIANYWTAAGNIVSLVALLVVTQLQGGLVSLVFALSGAQLLLNFSNALWLFGWHKPWLRPCPSLINQSYLSRLTATGGMFFVLQIAVLLNFQADTLIIARYLGAEQVTHYSIAWRLFSYTALLQVLLFPSLWPAYAEAFARKDSKWITRTFKANIVISTGVTIFLVVPLIVFGRMIIQAWAGASAVPSITLLIWLGIFSIINASMNVIACILNASGHIKGQMFYGSATAIVNIVLSVILVVPFGIAGVIAATVIAYVLCNVVPASVETTLLLLKVRNEQL